MLQHFCTFLRPHLVERLIVPATALVDSILLLTFINCSGVCEKKIKYCDSNGVLTVFFREYAFTLDLMEY